MSVLISNFRRPTSAEALLLGLIAFCCTVDASRQISIAGVSGLGAGTLAACGAVWAVWLLRPVLPPNLLVVVLPLILFEADALGTLLWYRPGMDGVQLATVGLTFIGVIMVTARETHANPQMAHLLHRVILWTSVIPVFACWLLIFTGKIAGEELNLTRPFALYSLCIVAVALATWLAKNRPAVKPRQPIQPRTFIPLGWALIVTYVVFLGLSRTALVAILIMMPVSIALRGNRKSVILAVLCLALGAGSFFAVLYSNQDLYSRFFHEDANLKVGGLAINATGRTQIWNLLLHNIGSDWLCGKGISASEDIVVRYYPAAGQPHNDYIRFYYDQGVVGLSIWLIFIMGLVYRISGNLRRSVRYRTNDYPLHLAALLGLMAVSFSMLTDNSVCYTPVMVPLAILIGSALGAGEAVTRRASTSSMDWSSNWLSPTEQPAAIRRPISRPGISAQSVGGIRE